MKKLLSISLALLVLVSSVGFSLNTHYCGGEAVKTSLSVGIHNPDCGMAKMDESCILNVDTKDQVSSTPCCDNQHQVMQMDEDVSLQSHIFKLSPVFLAAFVHSFVQPLVSFSDTSSVSFVNYSPPILDRNFQVLFQSFHI